ncbi:hypothetical protein R1sor_017619 [Riccia sorocarpa]|uniref:Uncharacterized protein n=1 Tax=Riccia sorocarpa TaxID=122646 RepID=A0ABD3IBE4_9MARC
MDVDTNCKRYREKSQEELRRHAVDTVTSPSRALAKRAAYTVHHTVEVIEAGTNRRLSLTRRTVEGGSAADFDQWPREGVQDPNVYTPINNGKILLLEGSEASIEQTRPPPMHNSSIPAMGNTRHTPRYPQRTQAPVQHNQGAPSHPGTSSAPAQEELRKKPRGAWTTLGRIQFLHRNNIANEEEYVENLKRAAGNPYLQKLTPEMGNGVTDEEILQAFKTANTINPAPPAGKRMEIEVDRDILAATLGKKKPVFALPWTPDFNSEDLRSKKALVWMDLPRLSDLVVSQIENLLSKVGRVVQLSCKRSPNPFYYVKAIALSPGTHSNTTSEAGSTTQTSNEQSTPHHEVTTGASEDIDLNVVPHTKDVEKNVTYPEQSRHRNMQSLIVKRLAEEGSENEVSRDSQGEPCILELTRLTPSGQWT